MRYAHLSPAYLSAEVGLLDAAPAKRAKGQKAKRARKGQPRSKPTPLAKEAREFVRKNGSSGWTRTNNPPVNSLTSVFGSVGSSWVSLGSGNAVTRCSVSH
jgi:hypothetical protein